jgi:hypothetical protein
LQSAVWRPAFSRASSIGRIAQRVIESVETLVRIHTAQEEDIYDAVVAG